MIIYYSGNGGRTNPEAVFGKDATVMLTFWDTHTAKGLDSRFEKLYRSWRKRHSKTKRHK